MQILVEIAKDEEFREEIKKLIRREIRDITSDEIRKMAAEHLQTLNIAQKVSAALTDLVSRQVSAMTTSYGKKQIEEQVKKLLGDRVTEFISSEFKKLFDEKITVFIRDYLEGKVATMRASMKSLSGFIDLVTPSDKK
jgi:uncharacterized protein YbcC (UPF0753/DUF2309 family)